MSTYSQELSRISFSPVSEDVDEHDASFESLTLLLFTEFEFMPNDKLLVAGLPP